MLKERIERKLNQFISENKIKELTEAEVSDFVLTIRTESRTGFYNYIKVLNEILEERGVNVTIESSDYVDECCVITEHRFLLMNDIQNLCKNFLDTQDAYICYALWSGIRGFEYKDLLEQKVKDIDLSKRRMKLPSGKMYRIEDDFLLDLIKKLMEVDSIQTETSYYDLNMDSPYLIKVRSRKDNSYGLDPMKETTLKQRLKKLTDKYNEENEHKIKLTGTNLFKSGVLFKMIYKEAKSDRVDYYWTIENVRKFLLEEELNMNPIELYRTYNQYFYGVNTTRWI